MNYSDRELLAKTLQAEAGNQGIGGLLDVGSVIMNRVGQSGGSLRDVILKPAQFSAWNSVTGYAGGEQGQDMANMKPDARAYMVADNLISGDYTDATGGATHYYNPSISNPDWGIKAGGNWAKRGDHVFGRPDGQPKMNIATGGQPMMQPEQKPKGLLGGFFSDPDRRARLAMGLEGMTLNPNQAFMSSLQGGIDKRAAGAEVEQKASKTIEALSRMNTPQAKQALEYLSAGGDPVAALKMAFGKPEGAEYETKIIKLADGSESMVERRRGTNDPWQPSQIPAGGTTGTGEPTRKLTADQSKLTLFQALQTETQPVLLELEKQFNPANLSDPTMARLPIAGNYFTSPEYQIYTTAASAWAEGALRISTGAAATQPEIDRNIKTYFAQPGDTPQTVAFKSQMRKMYDRAVNGALGQAPTGESLPIPTPEDFARQQFPNAPAVGAIVDGFRFKGGNPKDKNNWEKV
jgi:hypothetical protein